MSLETADTTVLDRIDWQPPEEFSVLAEDKRTKLYGVIFKPRAFDPKKSYPVIDQIYAGPQTTWAPHAFLEPQSIQPQALAQIGFIVVMLDARGTPHRGKAFQDVVYRNFGRWEVPDHVATFRELAETRPWMDLSRVGVYGGSFGGYMTVRAMLLEPDFFKVGVANASIPDLFEDSVGSTQIYSRALPTPPTSAVGDSLLGSTTSVALRISSLSLIISRIIADPAFGLHWNRSLGQVNCGHCCDLGTPKIHLINGESKATQIPSIHVGISIINLIQPASLKCA
jgi:hypothetical protein